MKKIVEKMMQFLRTDTPESSTRLNMFVITMGAFIIQLSIATYIVMVGIVKNEHVDFYGISAILLGIGGMLTSIYYQKVAQYKIENEKTNV